MPRGRAWRLLVIVLVGALAVAACTTEAEPEDATLPSGFDDATARAVAEAWEQGLATSLDEQSSVIRTAASPGDQEVFCFAGGGYRACVVSGGDQHWVLYHPDGLQVCPTGPDEGIRELADQECSQPPATATDMGAWAIAPVPAPAPGTSGSLLVLRDGNPIGGMGYSPE